MTFRMDCFREKLEPTMIWVTTTVGAANFQDTKKLISKKLPEKISDDVKNWLFSKKGRQGALLSEDYQNKTKKMTRENLGIWQQK